MESLFKLLEEQNTPRCYALSDAGSGLRAFLVIDDMTLGPSAGGTRTLAYPEVRLALEDAIRLARVMTLKTSLACIHAGGGKLVVLDHPGMKRHQAFTRLGEFIEELHGLFRTAGDLGTTPEDLLAMARTTQYVHTNVQDLARATGKGVLRAMEACVALHGAPGMAGLRVGVQGCGQIGAAVAQELTLAGAKVFLTDTRQEVAAELAQRLGATAVAPEAVYKADLDIFSHCAIGGVITVEVATSLRAWAVCGAANHIISEEQAERILQERGILFVPDAVASAGAAIEGIGVSVMRLPDRTPLIDRIRDTAKKILVKARSTGRLPSKIAEEEAWARIHAAKNKTA